MKKITQEEWDKVLAEDLTHEDLRYIIRYTNKKNEAGELLLKKNPTHEDLRYLIEYTSKAGEAQKVLDERNKKGKRMIDIIKER